MIKASAVARQLLLLMMRFLRDRPERQKRKGMSRSCTSVANAAPRDSWFLRPLKLFEISGSFRQTVPLPLAIGACTWGVESRAHGGDCFVALCAPRNDNICRSN